MKRAQRVIDEREHRKKNSTFDLLQADKEESTNFADLNVYEIENMLEESCYTPIEGDSPSLDEEVSS